MFTLVKEPLAWITVEWPGLLESGEATTHSIRAKVALIPVDELTGIIGGEEATPMLDYAERVVRDWDGVSDENGKLTFTRDNLATMLNVVPNFGTGFRDSYMAAWLGQGETREKNSASSPADGLAGAPLTETTSQPSAAPKD